MEKKSSVYVRPIDSINQLLTADSG